MTVALTAELGKVRLIVNHAFLVRMVILLPAVLCHSSCGEPPTEGEFPPGDVHAVFRGTVLRAGGGPVAGAAVSMVAYRDTAACTLQALSETELGETNEEGSYFRDFHLPRFVGANAYCLEVVAAPPAGSSLLPDTSRGEVVQFDIEEKPPDTAVVDLILPEAG